jgi:hypothetical protein
MLRCAQRRGCGDSGQIRLEFGNAQLRSRHIGLLLLQLLGQRQLVGRSSDLRIGELLLKRNNHIAEFGLLSGGAFIAFSEFCNSLLDQRLLILEIDREQIIFRAGSIQIVRQLSGLGIRRHTSSVIRGHNLTYALDGK